MVISAFLSAKYINSTIDKDLVFFAVIIIGLKSFLDLLFTSKFRVVFTAYEEKSLISIATLLEQIIYYLLVFMNLLLELPFMYLYLWLLFGCIVKIIFLIHIYKKKHAKIITKNKQKKKLIIHGTYYALANEVAHSIVSSSVAVIISFMYGLEEASVYAVYALVSSALSLLSTALYSAFAPSFGIVVALKDQKVIESTFSIFRFIYIVFNTVLMMCMLYLLLPFVRLYTKGAQDINYINSGLACLIAIGGLVSSFRVPYNIIVSSYGLFKQTWLQPSITAILSIILSLVLGRIEYYLILTGPIVFYLINFIYQHYKLKKIVPFLISKDIIILLAISVTGLYIAYEMIDWMPIRDGILGWIFGGFIAIVTSLLYLLVSSFIFNRKELINSITYIKDLILRRKVDD
jgi:O-antigen/teichoic acid export membrane protein